MKTDKFEKTIRRKLESITPEFHENDWTKMQNFMQANTPPTFWQQYSSWFGYAAAAAVTSVMVFLYVNQLSQTNTLLTDVKNLKNQIETIKNTPAVLPKTDTVYIVQQVEKPVYISRETGQDEQRYVAYQNRREEIATNGKNQESYPDQTNSAENAASNAVKDRNAENLADEKNVLAGNENVSPAYKNEIENAGSNHSNGNRVKPEINDADGAGSGIRVAENGSSAVKINNGSGLSGANKSTSGNNYGTKGNYNAGSGNKNYGAGGDNNGNSLANNTSRSNAGNSSSVLTKTLDENFDQLEIQAPVGQTNYVAIARRMNYGLVHRIAPKQVRNVLLATNVSKLPESTKNAESVKKVESTKKAETAIPKLNLKVPYRFGLAQQWEGKNQVRTILGEVLVTKNLSISTGFSWVKIKPQDFYSENNYNEKNRTDFKKDHYLPMALKITNLNIQSSLKQIPLNIAYRKDLSNDFAYFVGAGTNFTFSSKRDITYECFFNFGPRPGADQLRTEQRASEKMDLKLINSMNFSAGIEKRFHPVVLQAEGYLYSYFNPISRQDAKTGPGFKIKLLYQIGKKM